MSHSQHHIISDVVQDVRNISRDRDEVSVGSVVTNLGQVSQAGLMLLPALIAATPLSGIPGLTSVCGLMIAIIAGQMVFGRTKLWLPQWILRRHVDADNLRDALDKSDGAIRFLDRHTHRRWYVFVRQPGRTVIKLVCLICGLTMPFLELLPFTGSLMGGVVALLSISLLTKDGLFAILGLSLLAIAGGVIVYFL